MAALGHLVEIVHKADRGEAAGHEQAGPDEAVRQVHPEQRRDHQRDQDHQPAHRRRALFREMALRSVRSEEHTSELQSLMRISYAVFCLKKKNNTQKSKTK